MHVYTNLVSKIAATSKNYFIPLVDAAITLITLSIWACFSLGSLLTNRVLLFYEGFSLPWLLAALTTSFVAACTRFILCVNNSSTDTCQTGNWKRSSVVGVVSGLSLVLDVASLQYLPVPTVVLLQAVSPAVSYWLAVLMQQEDVQWFACLQAAIAVCCVTAALLRQQHSISMTGLAVQGGAVLLGVLWRRLQLQPAASHASTDADKAPIGLQLLGDLTPAAAFALLLPAWFVDLPQWRDHSHRLSPALPIAGLACMLLCCLLLLQLQPVAVSGLSKEPLGPLVCCARDAALALVAAKLMNEHLDIWQWVAYGAAQTASFAMWASISCSSSSSIKKIGFTRILPVSA